MKNILPIVLFSFLFLSTSLSVAQLGTEEVGAAHYMTNKSIRIYPNQSNYAGSVYENEEFVNGYIFKNGKTLASNVALRYNAKRDEIEVKKSLRVSNSAAKVLLKHEEIYIKILNKLFVYSPKKDGIDKAGYFMVLQEGDNYALYKKIQKKYIEGRESVNSITRDTPPAFKNVEVYYLVNKANGSFNKFPKSRKSKLKVFTKNTKDVKNYVNVNKLNINKEYALAKLVKFYDTL
jgi:hypothetical protein